MAKITKTIFKWQDIEAKSDLDRLRLCLENLPDERLMQRLELHRRNGRNDYPIRPMWNALFAGIVFQHCSIESLRRELSRNAELRYMCGFDPYLGGNAVPPASAFTRFLKNLFKYTDEIDLMFDELVGELGRLLPDFGQRLAIDSKAINSAGKPTDKKADGRRDTDADWGKKEYKGVRGDGTLWNKVTSWFGYKLHLLVDSTYEIPVAYEVTRASVPDVNELLPLVEDHKDRHPEVSSRSELLSADKGYDSTKVIQRLFDEHGVKPVIDIRNMWREEGDEIARVEGEPVTRQLYHYEPDNIVYDYKGTIYCVCPDTYNLQEMTFSGFEKDRETLKYKCPVLSYGMTCKGMSQCRHCSKSIRIPLALNRRIFTPLARSSYKWDREYKYRTAVERVNSRIDVSFGFEHHFIRGHSKMRMRLSLALIVMIAMAVGQVKAGRKEAIRSLIKMPDQTVKKKAA